MFRKTISILILFGLILLVESCSSEKIIKPELNRLEQSKSDFSAAVKSKKFTFNIPPSAKLLNVNYQEETKKLELIFNDRFGVVPLREDNVETLYKELNNFFSEYFEIDNLIIKADIFELHELIPNYFREKLPVDENRIPKYVKTKRENFIQRISKPIQISKGLEGKNIALWHSHGWYYNYNLDRWMWQRARLFQIVEDKGPMGYVLPFLVPMLENSGANVFLPRERDFQINEVVIDNDEKSSGYQEKNLSENNVWSTAEEPGFLFGNPPYEANYNPFEYGTHRVVKTTNQKSAECNFIPDIPEKGEYAVYVSYVSTSNSAEDAHYLVYHSGGITEFRINQKIGGKTWIYLGKFIFEKGINPEKGKVTITNDSKIEGKIISADAVRFGGGMGIVKRGGSTSGRPKFVEGARYWLQYAGMPDSLVYSFNKNKDDYKDDYQCRAEWVNYLIGNPYGPNKNKSVKGLGIPIDASMAFHTDAGITVNDTVVGTLSIYSTYSLDSSRTFPDGTSKIANRDLADLVQTQIQNDLTAKHDNKWNRRMLWDAFYSEAARQNVPSVLLELLSHQNFLDSKFELDPRFRFDVSRAIYKAFLKFIATENGSDYVVQPLPVTHFTTELNDFGDVKLSWKSQIDPLEPTADAKSFIVYTRINDGGFDNGTLVDKNEFTIKGIKENTIYSFMVTAVNDGGESFPSEILSVNFIKNKKPILIINGFDRICAPATIETDKFKGFADFIDQGVPYKYDLSYVGSQHNFDVSSKWLTDDIPGHGASYADFDTKVVAGNSFDYPFVHGKIFADLGYSFVSASDESVENENISLSDYSFIDLILGEEKETEWTKSFTDSILGKQFKTFSKSLQNNIGKYLNNGGNLFVSGSYIASDLYIKRNNDDDKKFANEILKYKLDSDHAVKNGIIISSDEKFLDKSISIEFYTELNEDFYNAEAPDAIGPVKGSKTLMRYKENLYSAVVGFKGNYGVVACGFPFETIKSDEHKKIFMKSVLNYLGQK